MPVDQGALPEKFRWTYEPNFRREQLGEHKYAKATTALSELVCNSFDAGARRVEITLIPNPLGGLASITVEDDGKGVSPKTFRERFVRVGVKSDLCGPRRFGRFGVGRFAVYRLGSRSEWETVSRDPESGRHDRLSFVLDEREGQEILVQHTTFPGNSTGTRVSIFNILENSLPELSEQKIKNELLASFISFLLTDPTRKIVINGQMLDPNELVERIDQEKGEVVFPDQNIFFTLRHVTLRKTASRDRFPGEVLLCGDGKLCDAVESDTRITSTYLAIVDSPYFSELARTNRESIVRMDPHYQTLLSEVQNRIAEFQKRDTFRAAKEFLDEARSQDFYPFKKDEPTPVETAKKALYDVALEKINEHVDLSRLTKKQQQVVFQLLNRAMSNSNIMEVLTEVAKLSDEDFDKFRKILERTTLDQVLRLTDEVTRRLQFLNELHELAYGEVSTRLQERKHLHKILEKYPWIFGEKYHLAASDKAFRTLIARHREQAGLAPADDESLRKVTDYRLIPDLYFTASRSFPIDPKNHYLIVEIKAPAVTITSKEVEQIKKYAQVVRESPQLTKISSLWELFLVSSELASDVDADRQQENRPIGLLQDHKGIKIWVFRWSELISQRRQEMELVSSHLKLKTQELAVSEDLRREFPFLEPIAKLSEPQSSAPRVQFDSQHLTPNSLIIP